MEKRKAETLSLFQLSDKYKIRDEAIDYFFRSMTGKTITYKELTA